MYSIQVPHLSTRSRTPYLSLIHLRITHIVIDSGSKKQDRAKYQMHRACAHSVDIYSVNKYLPSCYTGVTSKLCHETLLLELGVCFVAQEQDADKHSFSP